MNRPATKFSLALLLTAALTSSLLTRESAAAVVSLNTAADGGTVNATTDKVLAIRSNGTDPVKVAVGSAASQPSSTFAQSISIATPSSLFTNPVTFTNTSGAFAGTLAFSAQAANTFLAGPTTGSAATPTPRLLVPADIPTLNQNTTGQAGTVATISGLITAGSNTTITGSGTPGSPYTIASSGGGSTGGTNGQILYNSSGTTAGFTPVGDTLVNPLTGVFTNTEHFNVKNPAYGAKGDAIHLTNLTTTAGSTTISGYGFSAADIGKYITLPTSGTTISTTGNITNGSRTVTTIPSTTGVIQGESVTGNGIPTGTYVDSVVSSTSITLSNAASATLATDSIRFAKTLNTTISNVTGGNAILSVAPSVTHAANADATFGTDDKAAIQAAENAAAVNGGVVFFPQGNYVISGPIILLSNTQLRSEGYDATIVWLSLSDMAFGNEAAFTAVSGTANSPYQNIEVDNLAFDMSAGVQATYSYHGKCIEAVHVVNLTFSHLYCFNSPATGIGPDFVLNGFFDENILNNTGRLATGSVGGGGGISWETANGSGNEFTVVSRNIITNAKCFAIANETNNPVTSNPQTSIITANIISSNRTTSFGIQDNALTGSIINGNYVTGSTDPSATGYGISSGAGTQNYGTGTAGNITNNYVSGFLDGIELDSVGSFTPSFYSVKNNTVRNAVRYGIGVGGNSTNVISTLNLSGNLVTANQSAGVALYALSGTPSVSYLNLENNVVSDNGQSASTDSRKSGFYIGIPVSSLNSQGNYAFDSGVGYQKYGFTIESGVAVTSGMDANNHYAGNTTSAENVLGTFSGLQYGIDGLLASYPLTPGSTATLTNKAFDTAGAGNSFSINGQSITSVSGNTPKLVTASGTLTNGHCVSIDGSGNFVDAGGACTTGGGGGTVSSGTAGQFGVYASTGTTMSGSSTFTTSTVPLKNAANTFTAAQTFSAATIQTPVALTISASAFATDASLGNYFYVTLNGATITASLPTNPADGEVITYEITQPASAGPDVVTWNAAFDFGTPGAPTLSTANGKIDLVAFRYSARNSKWLYLGSQLGF